MIIPAYQGSCTQQEYFIYTACDSGYFEDFGRTLISSIQANGNLGIHLHLFNPTDEQLNYCLSQPKVSVTYEYVAPADFAVASDRWSTAPANEPEKNHYDRTVNAMGKGNDLNILQRMQKTYYACARFIRLAEIFSCEHPALCIDVDGIVRRSPPPLSKQHDFYLHKITGKKARILAGGMYLHPNASTQQFLSEYATLLRSKFEQDYIYWGLDQDLLDSVVPKYNHGHLPLDYIDWYMTPASYIWTAKGTRKDNAVFVTEKMKYTV
jgi:hypothetical protein